MSNRNHRRNHKNSSAISKTVVSVDRSGPDVVIISTEYDHRDRLTQQVRFEHRDGRLSGAFYTKFSPFGPIAEQWVLLYDENGRVRETYGYDAHGNPLDAEQRLAS